MLEILGGGVLGSLIGGAFRLAPELLKWLDKKNERQHELAMFERQVDLEKTRGQIKLDEIGAQLGMSEKTVSNHQTQIRQKLGVGNAVELLHYARTHGLLMG